MSLWLTELQAAARRLEVVVDRLTSDSSEEETRFEPGEGDAGPLTALSARRASLNSSHVRTADPR
jgi:hypothetical protein